MRPAPGRIGAVPLFTKYFVAIDTEIVLLSRQQDRDRGWSPHHSPEPSLARPRAFEEKDVLDAAIECFWRRGLEATSVRELCESMGLNQPSLYNAFGDKRALFSKALERYAARSMRERIERLERQEAPKAAIAAFFRELIARSLSDPDRRGCLIVNSALEVAPHDSALRAVIASYLAEIEGFFRRCLERARADGDIAESVNPRDAARLLLGLVLGLRVAARAKPERALLEGMVRPALALLDHPQHRDKTST
jgi:TetR/AcrR family transcriptional repressor of nem operon